MPPSCLVPHNQESLIFILLFYFQTLPGMVLNLRDTDLETISSTIPIKLLELTPLGIYPLPCESNYSAVVTFPPSKRCQYTPAGPTASRNTLNYFSHDSFGRWLSTMSRSLASSTSPHSRAISVAQLACWRWLSLY